jgi:hypothetical protein
MKLTTITKKKRMLKKLRVSFRRGSTNKNEIHCSSNTNIARANIPDRYLLTAVAARINMNEYPIG